MTKMEDQNVLMDILTKLDKTKQISETDAKYVIKNVHKTTKLDHIRALKLVVKKQKIIKTTNQILDWLLKIKHYKKKLYVWKKLIHHLVKHQRSTIPWIIRVQMTNFIFKQ